MLHQYEKPLQIKNDYPPSPSKEGDGNESKSDHPVPSGHPSVEENKSNCNHPDHPFSLNTKMAGGSNKSTE